MQRRGCGKRSGALAAWAVALGLVGAAVEAGGAEAAGLPEGKAFESAVPAPRLTLDGLPGDSAIPDAGEAAPAGGAGGYAASASGSGGAGRSSASTLQPYTPPKRSFALAAGEVVLLEALPWSVNRYLNKSRFAYISVGTVRENLETGFTYDRDSFKTDQSSHPFHGSLFFNAARSNGYSFWESGLFSFTGSFLWEVGMETEPPAINDLVNTTLGGMDKGEISHRLSTLLLDNTARGGSRFWRELGAAVLNPVGAFNRLIQGDLNRKFENPPDRFPSRFVTTMEGFYRTRSGDAVGDQNNDQGGARVAFRYGDPFDGERHEPYEYFDVSMDLMVPSSAFIARVESKGVLFDGPLGDGNCKTKQRLALLLHYNYYDNAPISYGAESFDLSHLMLYPLGGGAELRTEASLLVAPMAALQVDYERVAMAVFGRSFDYGPTGSVAAAARVRRNDIDIVKVAYSVLWQSTLDGVGKHSTVQQLMLEGRVPFLKDRLAVGAGWDWLHRLTTYDVFPTQDKSRTAVRLFAAVTFR